LLSQLDGSIFAEYVQDSDIVVVPEDDLSPLKFVAKLPNRKVVFVQNHIVGVSSGILQLAPSELDRYTHFLACSHLAGISVGGYLPNASISIVPAFADERVFRQDADKEFTIACTPRKREIECTIIQQLFERLYRGNVPWKWSHLRGASEAVVAATFEKSSVFLSLSRFEAAGVTTLEAMACGCIVAGFTGAGTLEYATPANGFWAADDDCESATRALLAAAETVERGGAVYALRREAARRTASEWSFERSSKALVEYWSGWA
jgi:glycosyltransferase involved in cell wall biosynthesis